MREDGKSNAKQVKKGCNGLRVIEVASLVEVYRLNPDGSKGDLLRIDEPTYFSASLPKRRRDKHAEPPHLIESGDMIYESGL